MASIKKINMEGADQGVVEASDSIFNADLNEALVHEVVVALQNAKRQGNHKTKTRREVRGGGAKPFRQKGTGRARQGSSREPQMRGGGTVFGPQPRSYKKNITVRVKRQALCCALSERLRAERLTVLSGLAVDTPKTKPMAQMLDKISPEGRKTLLVVDSANDSLHLSMRNIPRVTICNVADVNSLDVVSAMRVVVQEEALAKLEERLS